MPSAGRSDGPTTHIPRQLAGEFQPDVAATDSAQHGRHEARPGNLLSPGATIADGRYRLLVFHGGPRGLQFWQALDVALDRQVALTFVDPERHLPDGQIDEILARTLTLSRIEQPGLARVLDVTKSSDGSGLVVSEWIRGGSLRKWPTPRHRRSGVPGRSSRWLRWPMKLTAPA
jgi:putative peptidoglycan lipid II flippase